MFDTIAIIHSLSSANADSVEDLAYIIHEKGPNDVIAEYKGIRYTAIYNGFVGRYYVDDIHGQLPDQNICPFCGDQLTAKED